MVVFGDTWYAVREAKNWRYVTRNVKIGRHAVCKGEGMSSSYEIKLGFVFVLKMYKQIMFQTLS